MAKIGEGDPRWIVQDREDGSNVNGWHWQEKNYLGWAKTKLNTLFTNMAIEMSPEVGVCAVTTVKSVTGEASISTRKGGKKVAVFDLSFVLTWEGKLAADDKELKGEVKVSEFSSENDEDEYEWAVTADGKGKPQDEMKKLVRGSQKDMEAHLRQFREDFVAEGNIPSTPRGTTPC
mmetsp:Transcript_10383/g.12150  ORF Transcript_10383/g.12150 Transcript_10383/m.12150 type:complete len:176 (+) Transcript_10383:104-631(+)|eukprot:CAMPEP_0197849836 /NCGR_PEP_ID=MMETSP1438-20131217/13369_1 /TAXON_ID=1461541 /ORGANISM="Pterosperma sp., Strain CCMP1384" /LENGTH=175 /DNA_ID=CAMNT_0043462695 /DNA_START=104 /DNA_END=631 /DNA_ORIENTATION=-